MTSRLDEHVKFMGDAESEMLQLLNGMDYCLDWRPEPSAWSARQVVYHLLDTPPGGLHQVLKGMVSEQMREFEVWADLDNMTPERLARDIEAVKQDIRESFRGMRNALERAANEDLEGKSALVHRKTRGIDEEMTLQAVLDRYFTRHWGGHLSQVRELREMLGV